jgi:hypothetical protein
LRRALGTFALLFDGAGNESRRAVRGAGDCGKHVGIRLPDVDPPRQAHDNPTEFFRPRGVVVRVRQIDRDAIYLPGEPAQREAEPQSDVGPQGLGHPDVSSPNLDVHRFLRRQRARPIYAPGGAANMRKIALVAS